MDELDPPPGRRRLQPPGLAGRVTGAIRGFRTGIGPGLERSLSLFLPGAGQVVAGRTAHGIFYFTSILCLILVARAVLATMERLVPTLGLLGYPAQTVFVVLALLYGAAGLLHLAGALTAPPGRPAAVAGPHPVAAGVASLVLPGWGQLLNGDRVRAGLFLGAMWMIVGVRIAVSPETTAVLNAYLPVVGETEQLIRGSMALWTVRWTLPALVWALAVYDAATSAMSSRRR